MRQLGPIIHATALCKVENISCTVLSCVCRQAKIGPSQLGLAGGAVLFGLVFVLVSGGDFATSNRYKGLRPARPPPDPIEMAQLARQAEGFEARVQEDPEDLQVGCLGVGG